MRFVCSLHAEMISLYAYVSAMSFLVSSFQPQFSVSFKGLKNTFFPTVSRCVTSRPTFFPEDMVHDGSFIYKYCCIVTHTLTHNLQNDFKTFTSPEDYAEKVVGKIREFNSTVIQVGMLLLIYMATI